MTLAQGLTRVKRAVRPIKRRWLALWGKELILRPEVRHATEFHGTEYGGWAILADSLTSESVVLSAGVGEDVSFDLSLIRKYRCDVLAFDPTPKSIAWVRASIRDEHFRFFPIALSRSDEQLRLYLPKRADYVSASVSPGANRSGDAIEVPARRLVTLAGELGLSHIDLLKMDIEGAEYPVIADLTSAPEHLLPRQLLVEFHHFFPEIGVIATREAIETLRNKGYRVAWVSPSHHELLFVREVDSAESS
jgi:FkbM family methyltransferase